MKITPIEAGVEEDMIFVDVEIRFVARLQERLQLEHRGLDEYSKDQIVLPEGHEVEYGQELATHNLEVKFGDRVWVIEYVPMFLLKDEIDQLELRQY